MARLIHFAPPPPPAIRSVLVCLLSLAVLVSALHYLVWRWDVTNWRAWGIALPLFGAELLGVLHILGFHQTVWPRRPLSLVQEEDPTYRPLYILIPTVNEGVSVLEPTVQGALAARTRFLEAFPHAQVTIALCNDGRVAQVSGWQEVERLAARLGVQCVTRTVGGGAKAGNIEAARQALGATGDALLAIFDANMIARPEFLLRTVPLFQDSAVGWVQTGQYYHNLDNPVARWANDQQALFFGPICVGKAAQNAAFICGTNFVVRAAALDEIGGLPQDSITEDFAASILLHSRWRGLYLTDVLATGLGPLDLPSYFTQQQRWATGTFRVLKERWRMIALPGGGLRPAQRLQYALSCTHYLSGLSNALYLLAPLLYLYAGISAVKSITLGALAWHFVPFWLLSQVAFWALAGGRTHLRGSVMGFASFPILVASLAHALGGQKIKFIVTAKTRRARHPGRALVPHVAALLCCLGALGMAAHAAGHALALVWICALWVLRSCAMLCALLWLGFAGGRRGGHERPVRSAQQPSRRLRKTLLLALTGALALLGSPLRAQAPSAQAPSAPAAGLPGWTLTFDDEFNAPALNGSKWTATNEASPINGELQYYLPDDVTVQDGFLRIKSERRDFGDRHYTSGEVRSLHKFAQRYGRFEFRARLANTPGSWAAAYLLPESDAWPPEINVFEYLGRQPDTIHMTMHSIDADGRHLGDHGVLVGDPKDWSGNWHVYAIEWEPDALRFYIDGVLQRAVTKNVPDEPMYLRLNTAIGGWGESPDTGNWPQNYDLDYVRVYRRMGQPPTVSAGPDQAITLPVSVVRLNGFSESVPGMVKLQWTKTSGPGDVEFGDAQAASTFAQFGRAGVYALRLTATDGKASAFDEMRVFVNPRAAMALTPIVDTEADEGHTSLKWMARDYGYDPRLTVLNHVFEQPGHPPFHSQIYMKFDLSGLPAVGAARLRLYGGLHHAATKDGMTCGLYAVAGTDWPETGMTWATRPAQGPQIGTLRVPPALFAVHDQWLETDITAYVQAQQKAGAKMLALTIASLDASDGNACTFLSRDSDFNKPALVVTPAVPPQAAAR